MDQKEKVLNRGQRLERQIINKEIKDTHKERIRNKEKANRKISELGKTFDKEGRGGNELNTQQYFPSFVFILKTVA